MADQGTIAALKNQIDVLLPDNLNQEVEPADERQALYDMIDTMATSDPFDDASPWDILTPYIIGNVVQDGGELYVSLQGTVGVPNIGNDPSSTPLFWEQVTSAPFQLEWTIGVYGTGLVIVYQSDGFWKLTAAQRPYYSSDFNAEVTAGIWVNAVTNVGLTGDPNNMIKLGAGGEQEQTEEIKVVGNSVEINSNLKILNSGSIDISNIADITDGVGFFGFDVFGNFTTSVYPRNQNKALTFDTSLFTQNRVRKRQDKGGFEALLDDITKRAQFGNRNSTPQPIPTTSGVNDGVLAWAAVNYSPTVPAVITINPAGDTFSILDRHPDGELGSVLANIKFENSSSGEETFRLFLAFSLDAGANWSEATFQTVEVPGKSGSINGAQRIIIGDKISPKASPGVIPPPVIVRYQANDASAAGLSFTFGDLDITGLYKIDS